MLPRIASVLLATCLGGAGFSALAQNTLTVPMEMGYVSNPNLVPREAATADAAALARNALRRADTTLFRIRPQYTRVMVSGPSRTELTLGGLIERSNNTAVSANRSLPNLGLRWEHNSPTGVIGLQATLEEESTREAEFAELGRVTVDGTRRRGLIGATWAKELTASTGLDLALSHARVTYDTPSLRDYDETEASARYRWQPSPVRRYSLTASTAHQRRDQDPQTMSATRSRISRHGVVLGYEHDLNAGMRLSLSLGAMRADSPNGRTHPVGSFRLVSEGERFSYDLEWRRDLNADGTSPGYTRADVFSASLSHPLTVNTTLTLGARHARSLGEPRNQGSIVYARLRSELTQHWAATAALEYRRAQFDGAATGRGHAVLLGLVYTHPDF